MTKLLVMSSSPLVSVMLWTDGAKTMLSPLWAAAMAQRPCAAVKVVHDCQ